MSKPFSQACENNKQPILQVLSHYLTQPGSLLEVGSGTGQHAVFLSQALPHIQWQPSDVTDNLPGIQLWCDDATHSNLQNPVPFDVTTGQLPLPHDHLFTANTLHIMSWPAVEAFFAQLPQLVNDGGYVFTYGPFKYGGEFTTDSNAAFDVWLKQRAPHQGIRDIEAIQALAEQAGLQLLDDVSMPANNQTLVWRITR